MEEALFTQRLRAQQAASPHFTQRLPLSPPFAGPLYNPNSGAETTIVMFGAVALALYAATTVASYYLVRGVAPKKSANSYGAGAAAANLFVPIIGPLVVGIAAANAGGKR
jgi:hypothetical protein